MKPAAKLTLNLMWLYGGEVLAKGLPMLLFAWLARVLGPDRYGDLEFGISVWFILNLAQEAGLGPYGSREAAKAPERTGELAAVVVLLRAALAVLGITALAGLVWWLELPDESERIVALYGLVLLPAPFVLNWVFQARDEMPIVAGSSVLRQVVLVGGAFLVVRTSADGWMVPLCDAVGLACVAVLHQTLFRRRVGGFRVAGALHRVRRVVHEALPLAASSFTWAVRLYFPIMALRLLVDSSSTALFASGHRLVVAAHTFVWLYFFNLLPSLSRASLDPERGAYRRIVGTSLRIVAWTVLPGCLLLSVAAPWVMPLVFGPDFHAAAEPFRVQVWMLAAAFVSGHMRYALIAFDRQREEFVASVAGAAVSVGGCLLLGHGLDPVSAAVVFVFAEATTLLVANAFLSRRVEPLPVVRVVARPLALVAVVGGGAFAVFPESPVAATATTAALLVAGVLLLERGLVGRVRTFLASLRQGGGA